MSKQRISKTKNFSLCGMLDTNEDGKYIVTIETKDNGIREYELESILDEMCGTEIELKSIDEIDVQ